MTIVGITLTFFSVLLAGGALFYQKRDHVNGYGSTMGGEMTTGAMWLLVAILAGVGIGMILNMFWGGVATFIAIYAASFGIRRVFESMMMRKKKT